MARCQPELFLTAQIHTIDLPVHDRPGRVPADVAASQDSLAGCPVTGEDPLLTVLVLEIADVSRSFSLTIGGSPHAGL